MNALTRFANDAMHEEDVRRRTAPLGAPGNRWPHGAGRDQPLDREGIRAVVEQAIAITRLNEADPELLPLAETAPIQGVERFFEATARATPEERARAVAGAIRVVEEAGQTAAGNILHWRIHPDPDEFARPFGGSPRDYGAFLHHRHGHGLFRLG